MTLEDVRSCESYQSLVPLEGETLEQIFEHYLSQSEQTTAFLRLKADSGALCGLLLEKLPQADRARSRRLEPRHNTSPRRSRSTRHATCSPTTCLTAVFPKQLMRVFRLYAVEYHCPYDEDTSERTCCAASAARKSRILAEQGEVVIRKAAKRRPVPLRRARHRRAFR